MPTEKRSRHGLNAKMARVNLRGLSAIDRRTRAGRSLIELKRELHDHLGGESEVTTPERMVIDRIIENQALIADATATLLEQKTCINRRRKSFWPLVAQRAALVDQQVKLLTQIGLARREKDLALPPSWIERVLPPGMNETEEPQSDLPDG